jgi:hypothetical protein
MSVNPEHNPSDAARLDHVRRVEAALAEGVLYDPPADAVRRALSLVQPVPATPTLLDRAAAVARLVFDSFATPAPVGFRSAGLAAARHMTFDSDLGEIDLEITPSGPTTPGALRVLGQAVLAADTPARATFRREDGTTLGPIDLDAGRFAASISPGTWTLTIATGETSLTLPAFTMT